MKLLISLTILASLTFLATAQAKAESSVCYSCSSSSSMLSKSTNDARQIRNVVTHSNIPQMIFDAMNSHPRESKQFGNTCSKFSDGSSIGEWGQVVVEELRSGELSDLLGADSTIKSVCPGYNQMDKAGKEGLWVLIMASMAFYESSCDENPGLHRGPNGTLAGLMQLDLKVHADICADKAKTPRENKLKTRSAAYSLRCSMEMLNNQIRSGQGFFAADPYWQVIKDDGRNTGYQKIQDVISSYALCK